MPIRSLFSPKVIAEPYGLYRHMQQLDPVLWEPSFQSWLVTGYHMVSAVLCQQQTSAQMKPKLPQEPISTELQELQRKIGACLGQWISFTDPPEHRPLRSLLNDSFRARSVSRLKEPIDTKTRKLLVRAQSKGTFDLITDVANPLTWWVIASLLDLPEADHHLAQNWTERTFAYMNDQSGCNELLIRDMSKVVDEVNTYFGELISIRTDKPSNDALTNFAGSIQSEKLTHAKVMANCLLLFIAGQETTVNGVGNMIAAFGNFPDQKTLLCSRPELLDVAVEEALRFDAPTQFLLRTALEDFALGDKMILKGQQLMIFVGAANRDEARFEDPDSFNITRTKVPHLTFGQGIHSCLGAQLARMELSAILHSLCTIYPQWQVTGPMIRKTMPSLRGFSSIPMALG